MPSYCCGGNKQEGGKESQKRDNKKAKKGKLKEKEGAAGRCSVRHTNPYLKRWRLEQLPQQSQYSGNDGLWEVEGRQKAKICQDGN